MSKRPTMPGLFKSRQAQKPASSPPPAEAAPAEAPPAETTPPSKAKRPARASAKTPARSKAEVKAENAERVQILVRIDPATRKRLKIIAVEQDKSIQDLCEQAIRDIVKRNAR